VAIATMASPPLGTCDGRVTNKVYNSFRNRLEDSNSSRIFCKILQYSRRFWINLFQLSTYEILEEKYKETIIVYTDGFKKDNKVACAVIASEWKTRKGCDRKTMFTALNKRQ
jgi:hypothetical protein